MKRFFKCVCLLLAVIVMVASPVNATEVTSRASNYFMSCSPYLYEVSDTIFQACFQVTAVRPMEEIGATEIKIQRSSDNANWTTMKTYSRADFSNFIREDAITHSSYVTYGGTTGYYYRAFIKLYAKDSSGSATWSVYTSSIYLD